ncbi:MAG: type II toxin-antitoxin system VapC family toxin [Bifidobacteriaceae bacterium]|jgi:predicted nucleic acid-binding protein|nr:type II toxin-antitoxin system VapC family toxin [Bifidobacteriaceae bacterium]
MSDPVVLDTNVVSELAKANPAAAVLRWLDARDPAGLHLSTVTVMELEYGLARLPEGKRRDDLTAGVREALALFGPDRIWDFDREAAERCGQLLADQERRGRTMGLADAQIAAICLSRGFALATRNTQDFTSVGLSLVDPWLAPPPTPADPV